MITLCILLYVLGALPVHASDVRNSDNKWYDLVIVSAIWPLVIALVAFRNVYRALKEQ